MDISGALKIIFGTTLITAIAAIFAITGNFFNIRDRFTKWRKEKKRKKYKKEHLVENPDFKFTLNYISNPEPGKCNLRVTLLNVSKENKFIESFSYHFVDPTEPEKYQPQMLFMNGEKWPKRLEHGERFTVSVDFSNTIYNSAFQYWGKGVKVHVSSKSSTGDLLRSNSVDFDKLMEFLEPIDEKYIELALLLANKFGSSKRDIEISLWQLQVFKRLTVHIAKQLQYNKIPIAEYLIIEHKLIPQEDLWFHWYRDIEQRQIQPEVIEIFLKKLL